MKECWQDGIQKGTRLFSSLHYSTEIHCRVALSRKKSCNTCLFKLVSRSHYAKWTSATCSLGIVERETTHNFSKKLDWYGLQMCTGSQLGGSNIHWSPLMARVLAKIAGVLSLSADGPLAYVYHPVTYLFLSTSLQGSINIKKQQANLQQHIFLAHTTLDCMLFTCIVNKRAGHVHLETTRKVNAVGCWTLTLL